MLRETVAYHQLIYYFTWREFKVRYKQTVIGVLWVVFQPLFFALIINFTLLRGRSFAAGDLSVPPLVPVYLGLLFWNYFEQAINAASNSLIANQSVITKVYFPRFIPALSSVIVSLVDFFIASLLLLILLPLFTDHFNVWGLMMLVPAVAMLFVFCYGAGLFLATVNVKYRDLKYALPFVMRILMFAAPVFYPITFLPEKYYWLLYLNPVTTAAEQVRHFVLGLPLHRPELMLLSLATTLAVLFVGVRYFKKREREFADII